MRLQLALRRLLRMLVVLWGTSSVVFLLLHLSGDPVGLLLPPDAGIEEIERVRGLLGLDRPLIVQYVISLQRLATADFGKSLRFGEPALGVVLERVGPTLELAAVSTALGVALALAVGVVSAAQAKTVLGESLMGITLIGQSTPIFLFGTLLILVFSGWLQLLPTGGRGSLPQLVMPALTLALFTTPALARTTQSAMLEVLQSDYIRTARSKGLAERAVVCRHALKNVALPTVTVIGLQLASLLGGAVVTETIFSWPGMGRLVIQAIGTRDYPVVQAAVFLAALGYVLLNTLVDVLYLYLDPRIERL
jgi:peptide/nickel transport system permease protein